MLRDLIALPDHSKVWIYQSNQAFSESEKEDVRYEIRQFVDNWQSHQIPVEAYGNLFHQQFIVLVANEGRHPVSGCSIDSSVALINQIASKYNKDMFDRRLMCYFDSEEEIKGVQMENMEQAYRDGEIDDESLFFNNLVKTKAEFLEKWIVPLKTSWHYRFVDHP